jgi:hypothetical protein
MCRRAQYLRIIAVAISRALIFLTAAICGEAGALAQPMQLPLLQQGDLAYVGAFRVPNGQVGTSTFEYGGTAPAYNSANDSLFMVGHDWHQMVAEIKIPQIVKASQLSSLQTATMLQPFVDVTENHMSQICTGSPDQSCVNGVYQNNVKVGGLLISGNTLYGTVYAYYDGAGIQDKAHFYSGMNLSASGDFRGIFAVSAPQTGDLSGFMTPIPPEWQSLLGGTALTGQCCIPVTGRTSFGPAAFAFDPVTLGVQNPVPSVPLIYYPQSAPLSPWNSNSTVYNGNTGIHGVVFPRGTRSVLFIGSQGMGPFCYGGGGSVAPYDCYDPCGTSKGTHGYPYAIQVWAYDANDLIAVKSGAKNPWDPRPYALWTLNLPLTDSCVSTGGVAYDPANNRIFLSQPYGDAAFPLIHVLNVGMSSTTPPVTAPSPPSSLSVQ